MIQFGVTMIGSPAGAPHKATLYVNCPLGVDLCNQSVTIGSRIQLQPIDVRGHIYAPLPVRRSPRDREGSAVT